MTQPAFRQHDIVTFTPRNEAPRTGFLVTLTNTKAELVFERDGELRNFKTKSTQRPEQLIKALQVKPYTDTPIGATLQQYIDSTKAAANAPKWRKGQIVGFIHDGKAGTGRVVSGGKMPEVTYTATSNLQIPAHELTPADLPQPNKGLEDWGVSKHVSHGLRLDGEACTYTVTRKGKPVITVSEQGDGGPAQVIPSKQGALKDIEALEKALDTYLKENGDLKLFGEGIGFWAEYAWFVQPTGTPFSEYVEH